MFFFIANATFDHKAISSHSLWRNEKGMLENYNSLKVPYCTPFQSFILGVDVLKNIYLYQKPSQYIFTALFSRALLKTDRFGLSN